MQGAETRHIQIQFALRDIELYELDSVNGIRQGGYQRCSANWSNTFDS